MKYFILSWWVPVSLIGKISYFEIKDLWFKFAYIKNQLVSWHDDKI